MGLLDNLTDRQDAGSIFIDADSILWSAIWKFKDEWNIEFAYMEFIERIGRIRTEAYNQVIKLEDLIIGFTSATNFRYEVYKDYKATRKDNLTEEQQLTNLRVKELKKLVYKRLKGICKISSIFEADDLSIYYANYHNYMIAAIDKDVINASPTKCFNYSKFKWLEPNSKDDIERWYLIQSIMGDVSDHIAGVRGMGKVKAKEFVDNLLVGNKTFNDYIDLFDTNEHCLMTNRLVRMNQVSKDMKLKLCSIEDVIYGITGF